MNRDEEKYQLSNLYNPLLKPKENSGFPEKNLETLFPAVVDQCSDEIHLN